ncbi:MAG: sensor histidine kinase [Hyphomicrobiales bacterium]
MEPNVLPDIGSGQTVQLQGIVSKGLGPHDCPRALHVAGASEAELVSVGGIVLGKQGRFASTARDYSGSSSINASRMYLLPHNMAAHEDVLIDIKRQSVTTNPLADLHLSRIDDFTTISDAANKDIWQIWLRDWSLLTILVVGAGFSFLMTRGASRSDKNVWLPYFLASAIPSTFLGSLPAFQMNIFGPVWFWSAEFLPYIFFGFLHVCTVLRLRLGRIIAACVCCYYGVLLAAIIFDIPIGDLENWVSIAYAFIVLAACLLFVKVWKARTVRSILSPWILGIIVITILMLVTSTIFNQETPPSLDPLYIGPIAIVVCLLFAMADDYRKDKRALSQVTRQLLVAQDAERERLAKTLHDDFSHKIASARLRLEALLYSKENLDRNNLTDPIKDLVEVGMDMSSAIETLRPATLVSMTLPDIIAQVVDRWNPVSRATIAMEIDGEIELASEVQLQIYRILQEALYNSVRHADAEHIHVVAHLNSNNGSISIEDNGVGFDSDRTSAGIGLASMKERAELIDATFSMESHPGSGTKALLEFKSK